MNTQATLIGSTFPLSLVRRRVVITVESVEALRAQLATAPVVSFWGHTSTLAHANRLLNTDLSPRTERPALILDKDGLPQLDGESYHECWVVSPDYTPGFRPAIGAEVSPGQIIGWQVLRLSWKSKGVKDD